MIIKLDTDKLASHLAFALFKNNSKREIRIVHLVNYLSNMHRKLNRADFIRKISAEGIDESTL